MYAAIGIRKNKISFRVFLTIIFNMSNTLPPIFIERLRKLIPNQDLGSCLDSFSLEKVISIRANTLKNSFDEVCSCLDERGIKYSSVKWFKDALILHDVKWEQIRESSLFSEGLAYRQSISSMLVPVILSPEPDEDILDLCAAPGSKTTQIAAMMKNKGCITAVDIVKGRYYKLRSVAQLLGAENIEFKLIESRASVLVYKYRPELRITAQAAGLCLCLRNVERIIFRRARHYMAGHSDKAE